MCGFNCGFLGNVPGRLSWMFEVGRSARRSFSEGWFDVHLLALLSPLSDFCVFCAFLRLNNFPGTGGRGGNIDLWIPTGLPVVAFADSVPEVADRGDTDQVDRAAPETSPGHPGSQTAGDLTGEVDHNVELPAAHFVIIPQACV